MSNVQYSMSNVQTYRSTLVHSVINDEMENGTLNFHRSLPTKLGHISMKIINYFGFEAIRAGKI